MAHKREAGFTLIELLIVAIIVGILATLVAMTYSGVRAKNRNAERQANIDTLQSQMETYYAEASRYPSLTDLNNPAWRHQHLKDLSDGTTVDPQWSSKVTTCTASGKAILASSPTAKCYSYQATAADGSPCVDPAVACTQYTLTATLEGGGKYVKTSLN